MPSSVNESGRKNGRSKVVNRRLESNLNYTFKEGSTRTRKKTESFQPTVPAAKPRVSAEKPSAKGEIVSNMPMVCANISKLKAGSDELRFLHLLMFKTAGKKSTAKRDLKSFCGVQYKANEDKLYDRAMKEKKTVISAALKILCIDTEGKGSKEDLCRLLATWMIKPSSPSKKVKPPQPGPKTLKKKREAPLTKEKKAKKQKTQDSKKTDKTKASKQKPAKDTGIATSEPTGEEDVPEEKLDNSTTSDESVEEKKSTETGKENSESSVSTPDEGNTIENDESEPKDVKPEAEPVTPDEKADGVTKPKESLGADETEASETPVMMRQDTLTGSEETSAGLVAEKDTEKPSP